MIKLFEFDKNKIRNKCEFEDVDNYINIDNISEIISMNKYKSSKGLMLKIIDYNFLLNNINLKFSAGFKSDFRDIEVNFPIFYDPEKDIIFFIPYKESINHNINPFEGIYNNFSFNSILYKYIIEQLTKTM